MSNTDSDINVHEDLKEVYKTEGGFLFRFTKKNM